MGFVTPHGDDSDRIFERVYAGETAIRTIRYGRPPAEFDVLVGAAEWNPEGEITPRQAVVMDPVAQMAYTAGARALSQAGLVDEPDILGRAGIYMGCAFGGARTNDTSHAAYYQRKAGGRRRARPAIIPRIMANAPAAHISMGFGIRGPSHTYSVACSSSSAAIGEAYRAVRDGHLDCAVAGGAEAMLTEAVLNAWAGLGVIAEPHPDGPGASVRPFDAARAGFALGEGAGVLVLEAEEAARARGAAPLGEIVGYGASSDGFNLTEPSTEGQVRAIRAALDDAGIEPAAVGYVNAHATGTRVGDVVEIRALREAFGEHAERLAVSSTKSMHGHLIGAAGAVELGITLLGLADGRIPPTANLTDPDPECDLDCVPLCGRRVPDLEYALSNSFAFGGSNVSLVVRRVSG